MRSAVDELDDLLQAEGSPERAENEKRYLKSDLDFYGVSVPAIRRSVAGWLAGRAEMTRPELLEAVEVLWSGRVHELRAAAVELLERRSDLLEPSDIDVIEDLLRRSKTWALVDNLAASVAGPLLDRHPEATAVLDRWSTDDDFWIRRSALLAHLLSLRAGGGDFERFGRYADVMLEDTEFFIRKAIGWVLRDTSRRRPDMVFEWMLPRAARASGVTIREVVRHLPQEQATRLLAARSG